MTHRMGEYIMATEQTGLGRCKKDGRTQNDLPEKRRMRYRCWQRNDANKYEA